MFAKTFVAVVVLATAVSGFQYGGVRRASRTSLRESTESEPEQTVKDLNLEEMFEVFDAADKTVKTPKTSSAPFDPTKTVGASAPFGFFDPAKMSLDITEEAYKLYQEAEIKHGRVSMLAFLGMVVGEIMNPLFDGKITGPAIYQFQQADALVPNSLFTVGVLWLIAMIEGQTIMDAWQPLDETMKEPLGLAKLKKSHTPGNLKFDPLKLMPKNEKDLNVMKTKELNNGRLAM